ncbi:hypothetical protein FKP32DRAFT_1614488 [Trametes sanguinea]|nr:hypothetical protein FKP32DRAFT_1614488 [Trametes sanguinea]
MAVLGKMLRTDLQRSAIRHTDTRRELRDFWWRTLHGAQRVGTYWDNIPGYEHRALCQHCQVPETMEHILVDCAAPGRQHVWDLARTLLSCKGIPCPPITLGTALAAPCLSVKGVLDQIPPATDRILLTEATHLVWKLRCERVIDPDFDREAGHSIAAVANRYLSALNRRLSIDQHLAQRPGSRTGLPRSTVLNTWSGLLRDHHRLPEDWILYPGVLVGRPPMPLSDNG